MNAAKNDRVNCWRRAAVRVTLIYLFVSAFWILLSDLLLRLLIQDAKLYMVIETAKGWVFVLLTGLLLYWLILREFAKRNETEKALFERESQLSSLLTAIPDFIVFKDEAGRWQEANPFAVWLFDLQDIDYQGKTDRELAELVPAHRDALLLCQLSDAKVRETNRLVRLEERFVRTDGTTVVCDVIKMPCYLEDGRTRGLVAIGRDITERKEVEKELEESNQRISSIMRHHSAAIFTLDLQGRFLSVNPAAVRLSGYSEAELLQMNYRHFVQADDLQRTEEQFAKTLRGQTVSFELTIQTKRGRSVELGITSVPMIVNGERVGAYGIVKDVTEQKRTDELLRKSDKLALVGQLAAGVAHEIRNPLTSVKGFTQLMKMQNGDASGYYGLMLSELERIEFIISEFLVLSKPQAVDFERRNLQSLIKNITTLFDTQAIMSNVQIELHFLGVAPLVNCEENQLKQVFVNILKNSVEAMPQGGKIRIEVSVTAENQALIRIVDEGSGIDPLRLANLGEPFYTTKEKGTGLGLMISYKIIKDHQGRIDIFSEVGKGTTVEIRLPVYEKLRLVKT